MLPDGDAGARVRERPRQGVDQVVDAEADPRRRQDRLQAARDPGLPELEPPFSTMIELTCGHHPSTASSRVTAFAGLADCSPAVAAR